MNPWTNYPKSNLKLTHLEASRLKSTKIPPGSLITGNLRSYGDSCLALSNPIKLSAHDHFIEFDQKKGTLKAQAGVLLSEIIDVILPKGFFLPVSPGTKFISLGGAVANDIHGKNHVLDGCFGNHILEIGLRRSDGSFHELSPSSKSELFAATIGGLGLTGIIEWIKFSLKPISSSWIKQESIKFKNLKEFMDIANDSKAYEYTVAWVDCLQTGSDMGRGVFMRGQHINGSSELRLSAPNQKDVPFDFPSFAINPLSMSIFNQLYYHKKLAKKTTAIVTYDSFFYPLDGIKNWNRIYGKRGFVQYQFVIPFSAGLKVLTEIFDEISKSKMGSFLAVLKTFGSIESPGLLSFPSEGITLALDFPILGEQLFDLLDRLDAIVTTSSGRVYPAKDARMSAETFKKSFPNYKEFIPFKDENLTSAFWHRVMET